MKLEEIQTPSPTTNPQQHYQDGRSSTATEPVTVAAAPPRKLLTLALPIQQPGPPTSGGGGGGGGSSGGGREDCWSESATSVLIDAWGERYLQLSRGNLKQNDWKDVADTVSIHEDSSKPPKTDVQCKNRIDTLKKKYKIEKAKIASGQGPSKWLFFDRLDQLIGINTKINSSATTIPVGIPVVGDQTFHHHHLRRHQQQKQEQLNSESSEEEAPPSPDSTDSLPPEYSYRKRPHFEANTKINSNPPPPPPKKIKTKGWGKSMRELSRAIQEFGQAYERIESSKLQQMVEIEKQRIGLAKDLELKRMKFFMETQMELTQLKGRNVGNMHNNHINNNGNKND